MAPTKKNDQDKYIKMSISFEPKQFDQLMHYCCRPEMQNDTISLAYKVRSRDCSVGAERPGSVFLFTFHVHIIANVCLAYLLSIALRLEVRILSVRVDVFQFFPYRVCVLLSTRP